MVRDLGWGLILAIIGLRFYRVGVLGESHNRGELPEGEQIN